MPTNRKVVDFKIHNLTEEQFQELKAQGKIDPNAVYCTPDITKERLDALETKTTSLESKTTSLDTKTTLLENNKQDKGDYATNTALSEGLSQKQDVATAINYDNITNCITKIPQDIKLELNNGTLTIKAGSKIYYPNGSGVFNKVVLTTDKTYSDSTKTGQWFICLTQGLAGTVGSVANSVSGTSQPTAGFSLWYNTEENIMYRYGSITDAPASNISLPIAIITLNNTGVASIDQVFNGFGYIGSTLFALPGVKGLVPNRRNDDGTLKNALKTTTNVSVYTVSTPANHEYQLAYNGTIAPFYSHMTYNAEENINYNASGTTSTWGIVGSVKFKNNVIIELNSKTVFHAVDYNDLETITKNAITIAVPAGMIAPYAGRTAPTGWLKCDGSAVSRTTYASLFAAIGTTYGAGNGSTTFNLPTQSVLPLGTSAPVIGNGQAIGMTGTNSGVLVARDIGTDAGTVHGMLSITNNEYTPNGTLYKFTDSTGLKADLASATGAKAIVCIKY